MAKYTSAYSEEGSFTDRKHMVRQDEINRLYMQDEKDYPQTQCFDRSLDFLETNKNFDNWFLQIESFDPHEPFYVPKRFQDMIDPTLFDEFEDWPHYTTTTLIRDKSKIVTWKKKYDALLLYIDYSLGRLLDFFDENNMWENTTLILNTDHGLMFGEKEWAGKCVMPIYEEVSHTPFLLHMPGLNPGRNDAICQTYDIADTMYELYGIENKPETFGRSVLKTLDGNDERKYGYSGYFGGHVNIFDKKHTYMRAAVSPTNTPLEEYTLMPMRMREMFSKEELLDIELAKGYSYFKDYKVIKLDTETLFYNSFISGHELYEQIDGIQTKVEIDEEIEDRFCKQLIEFMNTVDAPASQYKRLGLDKEKIYDNPEKAKQDIIELNKRFDGLEIDPNNFILKQAVFNIMLAGEEEYIERLKTFDKQLSWELLAEVNEQHFSNNANIARYISVPN